MRSVNPPSVAAASALPLCVSLLLAGAFPVPARADLIQYWPLNENAGVVAPNSAPGGTQGDLFNGATWVTDVPRAQVLELDGVDGYVSAGTIPALSNTDNFTWSAWTKSNQTANNNVMMGNRFPDAGWCKFTTAAFEIRDIAPTFNAGIDYPDFAVGAWVHHAVTKSGSLFTYYRNGVALGSSSLAVGFPGAPFFLGGDTTNENWAGRIDDVALWTNALPAASVIGLAEGTYTPLTAPATFTPPSLTQPLVEDFSVNLNAWTATSRGLENNAAAGYNAPTISASELVLGGTTNNQYWFGNSIESNATFDSRLYSEVSVRRLSLSGSGTAWRSSLWVLGDATHYLHFSQNVGENGWSTNMRDDGGLGTNNPTGSGFNLLGLDGLDGDTGLHTMTIRIHPLTTAGSVSMEVLLDGTIYAVHGFTNFPPNFRVVLTGQARFAGDTVNAVFDDATVKQKLVPNLPPSFTATAYPLPSATIEVAYSQSVASRASDPENNPLTFSKTSGPGWVSVSAAGVISGTPPAGEVLAQVAVSATDNISPTPAAATFSFRVQTPGPEPTLFGWWPLNETDGDTASDISGQARNASILNQTSGGLDADFSAWINDAEFGNVLSFEGTDGVGACATVGAPPATGTLPVLDASSKFTWAFWCKPVVGPNTDIILGNRYDSNGVDFVPREFVKFTGLSFEWHTEGAGEDLDYPDMPLNAWTHNVIVKDGNALMYFRNGQFLQARTVTRFPIQANPLYFAGQNNVETWRGSLSDIRLFAGALSDAGILYAYNNRNVLPNPGFAISSVTRAPDGAVTIAFPTQPGKTYIVEGGTTLGAWLQISANATSPFTLAAGNPILDPVGKPVVFLRVKETN